MDISALRQRAVSSFEAQLFSQAAFIAEKLVAISVPSNLLAPSSSSSFPDSLSSERTPVQRSSSTILNDTAIDDVLLLARCYFAQKEYHRALYLLRSSGSINRHLACRLLAAQCLEQLGDWTSCLSILGEDDIAPLPQSSKSSSLPAPILDSFPSSSANHQNLGNLNLPASALLSSKVNQLGVWLLRARAFDMTDNRPLASKWYQAALISDPHCWEAFDKLVNQRLLGSHAECIQLLRQLKFGAQDEWLRDLYELHIKKQDWHFDASAFADTLQSKWKLCDSLEVSTAVAESHHIRQQHRECESITRAISERDPFCTSSLLLRICSLVELHKKTELFGLAHQKCTSLDPKFAPAWIAIGHAFSAEDESDQAMGAYRKALRLNPGHHMPHLFIAMEHIHASNFALAEQFVILALDSCSTDPWIFHELGVIHFRNGCYAEAEQALRKCLEFCPCDQSQLFESCAFNLGHALRKQGRFEECMTWYERCLLLQPRSAAVYSAIGFAHHLSGFLEKAIDSYHKALGIRPEDTFTSELLSKALEELANNPLEGLPADDVFE